MSVDREYEKPDGVATSVDAENPTGSSCCGGSGQANAQPMPTPTKASADVEMTQIVVDVASTGRAPEPVGKPLVPSTITVDASSSSATQPITLKPCPICKMQLTAQGAGHRINCLQSLTALAETPKALMLSSTLVPLPKAMPRFKKPAPKEKLKLHVVVPNKEIKTMCDATCRDEEGGCKQVRLLPVSSEMLFV
jgi:hypothetical protein